MSVFCISIIFLFVIYSADVSVSASEAITDLMICEIFNTGPLIFGFGSFSDGKIWAYALLRDLGSLGNTASTCAANIMSLFRKRVPSLEYVATRSRSCLIASSVSSVVAACWAHITLNATRSLLFTAFPTKSNAPKMPWDLLMPL